jgi:hypothetical protein
MRGKYSARVRPRRMFSDRLQIAPSLVNGSDWTFLQVHHPIYHIWGLKILLIVALVNLTAVSLVQRSLLTALDADRVLVSRISHHTIDINYTLEMVRTSRVHRGNFSEIVSSIQHIKAGKLG